MINENICPWCQNHKGKTDLNFSVIDDDFGQYVHVSMIKSCPFCGRCLSDVKENEDACTTCRFYPPSSCDGKPCSQCGDGDLCYQRAEDIGNIYDDPELLEVENT